MTDTTKRDAQILGALVKDLCDFYSHEESQQWLKEPQRLLGGATPMYAIAHGRLDEVLAIVDQLRSGAYV